MSLDDIRARAERASHGPWDSFPGYGASGEGITSVFQKEAPGWIAGCEPDQQGEWDGDFIAHARTDIPKLLAALDAVLDAVASPQDAGDVVCMAYAVEQAITEALQ